MAAQAFLEPTGRGPGLQWLAAGALCALLPPLMAAAGDLTEAWVSTGDKLLEHKLYWHDRVTSGEWPLWYPSTLLGLPHTALTQTGDFSPYNLLLLLFGPVLGANLLVLLPLSVAALGMLAALRRRWREEPLPGPARRSAPWIAAAAGLGFSMAGFVAAHRHHPALCAAASFVPWVLWAIEGRRWVWAGTFSALVFLGGNPQPLLLVSPWLLARLLAVMHGRWRRRREWIGLGLGLVAAIALALPQLLATLEYLPVTSRATMDYARFAEGSPAWAHFPMLMFPFVFGDDFAADGTYVPYYGHGFGIEMICLPGFLLVAAAIVGVLRGEGQRRNRLLLLLVGAFGVLGWLGDRTPFYWLLYQVPVVNGFGPPGRWILLLDLVTVEAAAVGLASMCALPPLRRWWAATMVVILLPVALLVLAPDRLGIYMPPRGEHPPPWDMVSVRVQVGCIVAATVWGLWSASRLARSRLGPAIFTAVTVAIIAVEQSFLGVRLYRGSTPATGHQGPQPGRQAVEAGTRLLVLSEEPYGSSLPLLLNNRRGILTAPDQRIANVYQPLSPRRLRDALGLDHWGTCNDRVVEQRPDLLLRFGIGRVLLAADCELRAPWRAVGEPVPLAAPRRVDGDQAANEPVLAGDPRQEPAALAWDVTLAAGEGAVLEVELRGVMSAEGLLTLDFRVGEPPEQSGPRAARARQFSSADADALRPWIVVAPGESARRGRLVLQYGGRSPLTVLGAEMRSLRQAPAVETASFWRARQGSPRQLDVARGDGASAGQTRVRFVSELLRADSREHVERALRTGIPPIDARTAFAHGMPADERRDSELGELALKVDDFEYTSFEVESSGGGWLVVNDMWMPGWRVWLNGEDAEPLVVDGWLRGVAVPPGRVLVEWHYRPAWPYVWPLSWLAFGFVVFVARRRRRAWRARVVEVALDDEEPWQARDSGAAESNELR